MEPGSAAKADAASLFVSSDLLRLASLGESELSLLARFEVISCRISGFSQGKADSLHDKIMDFAATQDRPPLEPAMLFAGA